MTHFLKLRLQTNQRLFALLIGLAIVSAHLLKVYGLSVKKHVTFTPYTAWLSMDFSGTSAFNAPFLSTFADYRFAFCLDYFFRR